MSKKRIGIVLNTAWNIYNFRLGLVKKLLILGYEVLALAPDDKFVKLIVKTGCRFVPLKNLVRKGMNPFRDLLLLRELKLIYKREKIDIVLHFTIKPVLYGSIAANNSDVKSINTITGLGYSFLSKGIINKLVGILYRFALNRADYILFQNKDDYNLFLKKRLIIPEKVDIVNGSGINISHFKAKRNVSSGNSFNFLFVGRLLKDKGIREYVSAAHLINEKYPNAVFHIVGGLDKDNPSGISKKELTNWLTRKYLVYHGSVKDTRSYIEKAHVVVLPSYREGLPRVMLEGMAMSRPLIATDVPGCRETVIDNHNGLLVEVKNVKDLFNAMEKMILLDDIERISMGKKGRMMAVDTFAEHLIIKKYINKIEGLISK